MPFFFISSALDTYRLWGGGDGANGRRDRNTSTDVSSPVQMTDEFGSFRNDYKVVAFGQDATLAIRSDGSLWAWGHNLTGALGLGDTTDRLSPVQVGTLNDWADCAIGATNGGTALAVKTDGTLWAWGENSSGNIGDGTTTSKSSPVQIGIATDWAKVFSGSSSFAIKNDGSLYAWGNNAGGALGLGDTTHRSSPVLLSNASWKKVSVNATQRALFLKNNGDLFFTGTGLNGQNGQNDTTDYSSPVQITGAWDDCSCGTNFCHGIKTDGTLWAWGNNGVGQHGNGTTTNTSSPVQIGADTDWFSVTGGLAHVAALRTDGTLYTWGQNVQGGLLDGTSVDKSSPVQIGAKSWALCQAGNNWTGIAELG